MIEVSAREEKTRASAPIRMEKHECTLERAGVARDIAKSARPFTTAQAEKIREEIAQTKEALEPTSEPPCGSGHVEWLTLAERKKAEQIVLVMPS